MSVFQTHPGWPFAGVTPWTVGLPMIPDAYSGSLALAPRGAAITADHRGFIPDDTLPVTVQDEQVVFSLPRDFFEMPGRGDLSLTPASDFTGDLRLGPLTGVFKYQKPDSGSLKATAKATGLLSSAVSPVDTESGDGRRDFRQEILGLVDEALALPESQRGRRRLLHFFELGDLMVRKLRSDPLTDAGGWLVELAKAIADRLDEAIPDDEAALYEPENLRLMIRFALCFSDREYVEKLAGRLGWEHLSEIIKLDDPFAREFYAEMAWYRDWQNPRILREQINAKLYHRTLISRQEEDEIRRVLDEFKSGHIDALLYLKDLYLFPFVEADFDKTPEPVLEAEMVKNEGGNLKKFLSEFGPGMTFKANQYEVSMPDDDGGPYRIDILLKRGSRPIIVELKKEKYRPEFNGKVEFYARLYTTFKKEPDEEEPFCVLLVPEKNAAVEAIMHERLKEKNIFVALWRTKITGEELDTLISESLALSAKRARQERQRLEALLGVTG